MASRPGWRTRAESSRVTFASRHSSVTSGLAVRPGRAHEAQRVDLHEVGVVGQQAGHEALGHGHRGAQVRAAQAQPEGELAGLEVEQAQVRVGVHPQDGLAAACAATSSISTPPSAEPITRTRWAARSRVAAR